MPLRPTHFRTAEPATGQCDTAMIPALLAFLVVDDGYNEVAGALRKQWLRPEHVWDMAGVAVSVAAELQALRAKLREVRQTPCARCNHPWDDHDIVRCNHPRVPNGDPVCKCRAFTDASEVLG